MKALTYHGPHHVQVKTSRFGVEQADDIILRITATAICGLTSIFIEAKYLRLNMAIFLVMNLWGKKLKPEMT